MISKCSNGLLFLAGFFMYAVYPYDDLSKRKVATQSMTAAGPYDLYQAGNAVDRSITTCTRTVDIGGNSPYTTVWWKVDLGGVYSIYSVNILFKNYDGYDWRQRGRFAGFSLYISNTGARDSSSLCYKDGPQLPPLNFTTICMTSGRYVTFYNERPNRWCNISDNAFTELCEMIVLGCTKPGVYGSNCNIPCPSNCRHNTCHIQNGNCFGCEPGWTGTTCNTKCIGGRYGLDCGRQCSVHCRNNASCDHVTGECEGGCSAGWRGSVCDKNCEEGTFGYNCAEKCGHCVNVTCNKHTGHCEKGCNPGYINKKCKEKCAPGYFGNGCVETCPEYCLKGTYCDHVEGVCVAGCQDGYEGIRCNESCHEGYFGSNCSFVCSPNCMTCDHINGECSCYAGWTGSNCIEACSQSYGEDCRYPCSDHCLNQTCDKFNGSCLSGCASGYQGENCDQGCLSSYGEECRYPCSAHCIKEDCDRFNGSCLFGCVAGFKGEKCDQECLRSYGHDCKFPCSQHCYNQSCDTVNGICLTGCTDDFFGEKCDQGCLSSYGEECRYPCSAHCIKEDCDRFNYMFSVKRTSSSPWGIVGPVVLGINVILIIGLLTFFWSVYTTKVNLCRKLTKVEAGIYKEAENSPEENSYYEELGVYEGRNPYQNTTLH